MAVSSGGFVTISFQAGADPITITKQLASWNANIQTMAPAWEQVGDALLQSFDDNFSQEGGYFGGFSAWPALRPATVKDRIRQGFGGAHPILFRTGELRQSTVLRGTANNIFQVGANSLVVGTADRKAAFHQYGTRKMAARPIVGVGWKMQSTIIRILNEYVQAQARAAQLAIQGGGV